MRWAAVCRVEKACAAASTQQFTSRLLSGLAMSTAPGVYCAVAHKIAAGCGALARSSTSAHTGTRASEPASKARCNNKANPVAGAAGRQVLRDSQKVISDYM